MYTNNTINKVRRIGILLSLTLGLVFILHIDTQAQRRYRDRDNQRDNWYWQNDYPYAGARVAQDNGYRDGLNDGADAAREGDAYHPENSGDWQKATNGYEGRFGNKNAYRQAYRSAYIEGYRAGYQRRNDRGSNYRGWRRNY